MAATSYSLGIDLGTTFTAAAVHRNGRTDISPLGNRAASIPSLVFLRDDETILTGEAAERRGLAEPARLAREFKRRVGDSVPIMLGQAPYSAERLMAALLKDVIAAVATREGAPPASVAVSHPANWGPFKIDLLHHALEVVGLLDHRRQYAIPPAGNARVRADDYGGHDHWQKPRALRIQSESDNPDCIRRSTGSGRARSEAGR